MIFYTIGVHNFNKPQILKYTYIQPSTRSYPFGFFTLVSNRVVYYFFIRLAYTCTLNSAGGIEGHMTVSGIPAGSYRPLDIDFKVNVDFLC